MTCIIYAAMGGFLAALYATAWGLLPVGNPGYSFLITVPVFIGLAVKSWRAGR